MIFYNLIEYSGIYLKTMWSLWQNYRDKPALNKNNNIIDIPANNNSILFKCKENITEQTENNCTKNVEKMTLLKYL